MKKRCDEQEGVVTWQIQIGKMYSRDSMMHSVRP